MLKIRRVALCLVDVFSEIVVGNSKPHLRLANHIHQFPFPQHGHGRNRDPAGLEDSEPRRDKHWMIAAPDQHALARHKTVVFDQHVGDPVSAMH